MTVIAKFKKIDMRFSYLISENIKIFSDESRLKQILMHLIGNAFKFTLKGFVELKVMKSEENYIKFEVIDTGIGIKQEMLKQISKKLSIKGIGIIYLYCLINSSY